MNLINKDLLKIMNIEWVKNMNLSINCFNKLNMNPSELIYIKLRGYIIEKYCYCCS